MEDKSIVTAPWPSWFGFCYPGFVPVDRKVAGRQEHRDCTVYL